MLPWRAVSLKLRLILMHRQIPLGRSYDLHWENKINKLKRFIDLSFECFQSRFCHKTKAKTTTDKEPLDAE